VLIAVLPNVIGYALLALRWVQRRMARPEPLAASVRGRQQVSAELLEQPDEAVIAPPLEDPSVGQPVDFATGPAHGRTPERFDAPSTGE
jgi:hypothetical protein